MSPSSVGMDMLGVSTNAKCQAFGPRCSSAPGGFRAIGWHATALCGLRLINRSGCRDPSIVDARGGYGTVR